MYAKYFGLSELPFRITPDPRFLWYSDQHQNAKEKILYHITQSVGPIYLLADIGTGKTTLAKRIIEELSGNERYRIVFAPSPNLKTTNAFLRFVMDEYGVKTERSFEKSLKNFQQFLIEQKREGVSPILLVDEAQNMSRDMLVLIQHLFNFSTDTEFLIQMVLFAQLDFQPKLERLPSLLSRLNLAKLQPLDLKQTKEMMQFRWTVAGGKRLPFDDDAIAEVYRVTHGVPRAIVKVAHESLIRAAVNNGKYVDKDTVGLAWSELTVDKL
ncbi:MAG: AAA family ATPase [Anaerolineae bacterium]|nr:AAA family ATPase [Anaerolineae bacterium]